MATPRPELVAAWRAYKAEARRRWCDAFGVVRRTAPHAEREAYMPEAPYGHDMRDFMHSRREARLAIDWEVSREPAVVVARWYGYGDLPTYRWTAGAYRYVVQVVPDWGQGIPDSEGRLSEREPRYPLRRGPWAASRRCPEHGWLLVPGSRGACPRGGCGKTFESGFRTRALRGPGHRFYWEVGGYDRGQGQQLRREYQYGHVSDYTYEEWREEYWLQGLSRRDADAFARQIFEQRRRRLERYAEGDIWDVGVVAYLYRADADCDHCPLEEASVWGIESDCETAYIEETVREQAEEVRAAYEQRLRSPTSSPTP